MTMFNVLASLKLALKVLFFKNSFKSFAFKELSKLLILKKFPYKPTLKIVDDSQEFF